MSDVPSVRFGQLISDRYGRYGRYILGFRHFAEGRDGLLPVQRRSLWSLHKLGAVSRPTVVKTAKAAGYCMGSYHPHGDAGISLSIAKMAQAKMKTPLVVGVGNFGRHDAGPANPRYTSCYLSAYARSMMDSSELSQVPMDPTYDGKDVEPRFLPVALPHLLVGGCTSIAAGYSGCIPPCDPEWVLAAVEATLRRRPLTRPASFSYRWGGTLIELDPDWTRTGGTRAKFDPVISTDAAARAVVVSTLAPGLSGDRIATEMERCPALASVSEESPHEGELVRILCVARRGGLEELAAHAGKVLHGSSQRLAFLHVRQFSSPDGIDYQLFEEGPTAYLQRWVAWRRSVVVGAARYRIGNHLADITWLELLLRAIAKRVELAKALGPARDRPDLERRVRAILRCTEAEAARVCEVQFYRLASMNEASMRERIAEHQGCIRTEERIVAEPRPRLLADAERAHKAVLTTMADVQKIPVVRKKGSTKHGRR